MNQIAEAEAQLSVGEIQQALDDETRRRGFGDSWAEALDRYNHGDIEPGDIGDLLILSDLLPRQVPA